MLVGFQRVPARWGKATKPTQLAQSGTYPFPSTPPPPKLCSLFPKDRTAIRLGRVRLSTSQHPQAGRSRVYWKFLGEGSVGPRLAAGQQAAVS